MKIQELMLNLEEGLVSGEFKIGFELEAYYGSDTSKLADYSELKKIIKLYLPETDPKIMEDSSLATRDDRGEYIVNGFEFASKPYEFNPANIKMILNFLKNLPNHDIYTTEKCGFHVHISYPGISKDDAIWIISHIVLNKEKFQELQSLGYISFWEGFYAATGELEKLRDHIIKKDFDQIAYLISNEKYRILRIHPQGTIEWRGPRDFLGKGENIIKNFLIKLWNFVGQIIEIMNTRTILDMSKEEYLNKLNQLYKTDTDKYKLSFGDKNKIERILEKIKKNPKIINKLDLKLQKLVLNRYPESIIFLENPSDELLLQHATDIEIFKKLNPKYQTKDIVHKIIERELYLIVDFYIYLNDTEINDIFNKNSRYWFDYQDLENLFFELDRPILWKSLFSFLENRHKNSIPIPRFSEENQVKIIKKNPYALKYMRYASRDLIDLAFKLIDQSKSENTENTNKASNQ